MSLSVLGLDVGGANLKAAWYRLADPPVPGEARSQPFALWREPDRLEAELRGFLSGRGEAVDLLALTMTGELCDCFASKRDGVRAILKAVQAVARSPVRVWTTQGRFVGPEAAAAHPLLVASANWLALAAFACRWVERRGSAVLIDVGSTTTDLIPLRDGLPVPQGRSDPERLRAGELVYTGVRRTPVCALVPEGLAAEMFATTLDVYLLLGHIPEVNPALIDYLPADHTADGQPPTLEAAHRRLARMLGADLETSTALERRRLAEEVAARQTRLVAAGIDRVLGRLPSPPSTVILAGEGEFLARAALELQGLRGCTIVSLREVLGEAMSNAACAHAVAVLAAEEQRCQGRVRTLYHSAKGPDTFVPEVGRP
jgi:probable H4MPT-linked C1 transfer pathway protein